MSYSSKEASAISPIALNSPMKNRNEDTINRTNKPMICPESKSLLKVNALNPKKNWARISEIMDTIIKINGIKPSNINNNETFIACHKLTIFIFSDNL